MLVNLKKLRKNRSKNRIAKGIYVARGFHQFNFDYYLESNGVKFFDKFNPITKTEDRYITPYGVCDNPQQILEYIPKLESSTEKYVIGLTRVKKVNYPRWRWHKWGKYIGNQKPTQEYLGDERDIDEVYFYQIYHIK